MDNPEWLRAALDVVLIAMVAVGLVQAGRLIKHLAGLQESRVEMEKFVRDFSATVYRAEAGIKSLKQAARDSGDDLEKLVQKAVLIRDELNFIVGSADQIAERLSHSASHAVKSEDKGPGLSSEPRPKTAAEKPSVIATVKPRNATGATPTALVSAPTSSPQPEAAPTPQPSSRAEQELLQALQKLS